MGQREWFDRTPGSPTIHVSKLAQPGGEVVMLLGDTTPDVVRLPHQLGGHVERVTRAYMGPCPVCECQTRTLELETLSVAECMGCGGFMWYRRRANGDGTCPDSNGE